MALSAVSISCGGVSGQTTEISSSFRNRMVALGDKEGKREPPLAAGELALFEKTFAVFDRNPPRQVDSWRRQGFAKLAAMFEK